MCIFVIVLSLILATAKTVEGESRLTVDAPIQTQQQNNDHFFSQEDAPFFTGNATPSKGASSPNAFELYAQSEYGHIPYFVETLKRESGYQSIQSRVINKYGVQEPSYGCAQIHEPSHPTITREQAMDCIWSIDWAAQQFLKGKATMWTEYRKITNL